MKERIRPVDDQVSDALRWIRDRREIERQNGVLLRLLLAMIAVSWLVAMIRTLAETWTR
jgi:hypothetical protein